MSRIGKKPIDLPDKVTVDVKLDGAVTAQGPMGTLKWYLPKQITAQVTHNRVDIVRGSEDRKTRALHGLSRALVANMVAGVSAGFSKSLEIQGVGFKAALQGKILKLNLGFSHDILFPIPDGIKISVADNTKVKVEGVDKHLVGQVASDIRNFYPPEPYKGKGVRYSGEQVVRKEGKTVQ